MDPSSLKKARTGQSPAARVEVPPATVLKDLPADSLRSLVDKAREAGPQSPLFYQSSKGATRHAVRPSSFPTSDVAATILSRIREENAAGVTTLKLPRASVSSVSPARSGSTPGSWGSSMDFSTPLNQDARQSSSGLQMLQGIGVLELLEHDDRPTFLVDLRNPTSAARPGLRILYHNAALRASDEILRLLSGERDDDDAAADFGRFKAWVLCSSQPSDAAEAPVPAFDYGGITWSCSTVRKQLRFVSGSAAFVSVRPGSPPALDDVQMAEGPRDDGLSPSPTSLSAACAIDPPDYFGDAAPITPPPQPPGGLERALGRDADLLHPDEFTQHVLQSQPLRRTFDWTKIPLSDNLPEHIRFAKSVDWASTPLGPMEEWSQDLIAMSNMVMGSPHPACIYWGPQYVCIYNAAYIDLAGQKHPSLMGMRYMDAWSEIWDEVKPAFDNAWCSGQATMKQENHLFINRHGFLEETFFSWSLVPLVGGEGEVAGLYNPAFENTRRRVNERRMLTLREIGERTATATTVSGFWPLVRQGLEYNEYDVPFALIYSVKDDLESEVSSLNSGSVNHPPLLVLEGALGVPDGHPAAATNLDLRFSMEGFAPHMRRSINSPVILSAATHSLPLGLIQGLEWRGFGDPCTTIVVFPVIPNTAAEAVTGFIVLGVNPRRPYDDDYQLFVHLLSRQLATSMASAVLFEEEIKRGQRAARLAALDRQELSTQLLLRTQEANESELKFTKMAEFAPVGMFIADSEGVINYCNDMWWQISRHSRVEESQSGWMDSVKAEDRPSLEAAWRKLFVQKVTISIEFRFKCSQQVGDKTVDTWVLMSAFPEKTQDGSLKSIFGCITDISSQKWAEKVQSERREEAVELKRQQENFIDITSHEMRNPLSAILQCADQIAGSISSFAAHSEKARVETLMEGCLDAANTINLCASHQKRIVDDILTLSKLDSNFLTVTPVDEQPIRVVRQALAMFESELGAHDIELEFIVDESFEKYGIQWIKLDPSRLRQILINLMTNAIKFTQGQEERRIIVSLSASKEITDVATGGTVYFDRNDNARSPAMDIDKVEEWGDGEKINLHCSVEDTGPGLGDEERKLLFQRFHQATPRTHVQYGGSGLGLFISKILTELQGGQIGVSSEKDKGSKFSFYVQSRTSVNPPADYEPISPFKFLRKSQKSNDVKGRLPDKAAGTKQSPLFDVLIVEDNLVNQKVLQRQLRNWGNNTFVANHGKEALQTLQRSRFWTGHEAEGMDISVILMDLEMPVMDGMTCARRIRELEREGTIVKHIPIIAVTAYARPEQIANAKAAGIVSVLDPETRAVKGLTHWGPG